jgi:hypothetical protein
VLYRSLSRPRKRKRGGYTAAGATRQGRLEGLPVAPGLSADTPEEVDRQERCAIALAETLELEDQSQGVPLGPEIVERGAQEHPNGGPTYSDS